MAALIFLVIGVLCALIGRILLSSAAFRVSVWCGLGVFLPFGPLLFRLSHPHVAPSSKTFRLAALPCILAYILLRPESLSGAYYNKFLNDKTVHSAPAAPYGVEKVSKRRTPLEEHRIANNREFERLAAWNEALRFKKRDLLNSDVEGNRAYNIEVAQYNAALAKANADKTALWSQDK
ncbi:MAG TPA: hypothetical protein VNW72_05260 [Chthoniobacterales bacterium]|nr:hypothetical protein [Chthoniobacterales bacterium]